jgi:hypothetical protein
MVLALRPDGSFTEQLLGFPALRERTATGTWLVSDGHLILSPCVLVDFTSTGYRYMTAERKDISVIVPLFGGDVRIRTIEDLYFHRAPPN